MRQSNLSGFQKTNHLNMWRQRLFLAINMHFLCHTHTGALTMSLSAMFFAQQLHLNDNLNTHRHTHTHREGTTKNGSEIENNWNRWQAQHALKCATHAHTHTQGQTHIAHLEHLTALRGDSQHVCVGVCMWVYVVAGDTHIFVRLLFSLSHIESHFLFDSEHWNCCRTLLRCRWRIRNIAQASIEQSSLHEILPNKKNNSRAQYKNVHWQPFITQLRAFCVHFTCNCRAININ